MNPDGPVRPLASPPVLDYQGQPDTGVTWITREGVLQNENELLREEVAFLRGMLRLALASNTETEGDS